MREVPNGKLFSAGPPSNPFHVVHVFGSPYEMGLAQAQLYPELVASFYQDVWTYMQSQIEECVSPRFGTAPSPSFLTRMGSPRRYLKWLPPKVRDSVSSWTIEKLLDWQERQSKPFVSQYFLDELRGISDGASVDYDLVLRVHMLPELEKGASSET